MRFRMAWRPAAKEAALESGEEAWTVQEGVLLAAEADESKSMVVNVNFSMCGDGKTPCPCGRFWARL